MVYKDFAPKTWNLIQTTLDRALAEDPGPHYAAFDADGTLWDIDMGESFLRYQALHCALENMPEDPWKYYHDMKEVDTRAAYLWLAQMNKGRSIEEVRAWAKDCADRLNIPTFSAQKKLIDYLKEKGVEVYIVTASIKWAVEPAAALYGLGYDQVFGIETFIEDGIVTEKQKGVITWREGKKDKILEVTGGKAPILASGNTMGDFWLLDCARHIKLAVTAGCNDEHHDPSELDLQREAKERGWITHSFVD